MNRPFGTLAPVTDSDELAHASRWGQMDVSAWTDVDYHLSERTRQKLREAIPAETLRAYERWWTLAADWCTATNRVPLPMHHNSMTEWIRVLTDTISPTTGELYSVSSLDQAVAAVRKVHTIAGFDGMPGTTQARTLIRAHGKTLADSGRRVRKSAVLDRIEQWYDVLALDDCSPTTLVGLRNRVLVALSLNLWTRRGELCALNLADITVTEEEIEHKDGTTEFVPALDVFFKSSKTDQAGKGHTAQLYGRTDALCPVTAYVQWHQALAELDITQGRLLRSIDRWGNLHAEMSGDGLNRITKNLVDKAGYLIDRNGRTFTSHGWRASGYSVAKKHGATDEELEEGGRWSPKSEKAKGYGRSRSGRSGAMRHVQPRVGRPSEDPTEENTP
ncbi:hypothetical protein [Streptomyces hydrogenans]|uniref:hypothetical protein n=1 Tax=Streptomyces hydrogenans TaxID=1873719 RepID=UPI0037F93AD5